MLADWAPVNENRPASRLLESASRPDNAGIETVQEIPDHVTPVRRGHPAEWVAEVSSGHH
jgi:hypothetical protein